MGPLAPIVDMAGGALLPWGVVSEGLEGLTLGRRLLAHTGVGGGMGAIYGVGASPDLTDLAQTLQSMARSGAMGGVLGVGLPHVMPLAAGLARSLGSYAAKATDTFSDFGTTLFDHGTSGDDGASGGAYTGRRYDPETGLTHDQARAHSPSLGHFLQADPISTQGGINLDASVGRDPANVIDPWGAASLSTPSTGPIGGFAQSIEDGAGLIPTAEETPQDPIQQKGEDLGALTGAGAPSPSQPFNNLIQTPMGPLGASGAEGRAIAGVAPRALTESDLGIAAGSLQELDGTYAVTNGTAIVQINMIRGVIKSPFRVIVSLAS